MTAPLWAQELILKACLAFGKEDPPELTWRRARSRVRPDGCGHYPAYRSTSGYADVPSNRIVLTAGTDRADQKRAVLHELAHLLAPRGPTEREHHSPAFWDTAWTLYRWAGIPLRATLKRESRYRRGAALAYARSRKA